jgi:hypothetical protein
MRSTAGWFLLAFGAAAAVVTALGAWSTWGADPESFGFGSYTLPLAWGAVLAVAIEALGAWLLEPPRSAALWGVGAFIGLVAIDLLLRSSDVLLGGELDAIQLNEGEGTRLPVLILAVASATAFGTAAWFRHLRRSAVSPG